MDGASDMVWKLQRRLLLENMKIDKRSAAKEALPGGIIISRRTHVWCGDKGTSGKERDWRLTAGNTACYRDREPVTPMPGGLVWGVMGGGGEGWVGNWEIECARWAFFVYPKGTGQTGESRGMMMI
jgi:hypothetical protein